MISAKKHIAPIFLIAILCLPAMIFLYLQIHQKIVQHEMVEKLERSELETITLHNNAVRWYKKNKEIIVNSTLFDVHRYRAVKDSTVFTGLFDVKETELKSQVRKLFERRNENSAPRELIIAKLILQLWIASIDTCNDSILNAATLNKNHIVPSQNLLTAYILVPFPPPKA